jgi:GcrA cell cycle regulator
MNYHVAQRGHNWTAEELGLLKAQWIAGKSAQKIADELGQGITKNAVIGKVHKLKLADRAVSPAGTRLSVKAAKPTGKTGGAAGAILRRTEAKLERQKALVPLKMVPFRPGKVETIVDPLVGIPFVDTTSHTCKWPLWTDETIGNCCGAPSVAGRPYCETHERRSRVG